MSEFLDRDIIAERLDENIIGADIAVFKSTASTNDAAWRYAGAANANGKVVLAETQTAGRGRGDNRWEGGEGGSVLCSILLKDFKGGFEHLSIASAVAVCETISAFVREGVNIKWPNDVLVRDKKCAGILIESRGAGTGRDYVIGVGINCRQDAGFFEKRGLISTATSIDIETETRCDRNEVAAVLLEKMEQWIYRGSERVCRRWKQLSGQLGNSVRIEFDRKIYSGTCVGVDPAGGLILQLERGGVRMFPAMGSSIVKEKPG